MPARHGRLVSGGIVMPRRHRKALEQSKPRPRFKPSLPDHDPERVAELLHHLARRGARLVRAEDVAVEERV